MSGSKTPSGQKATSARNEKERGSREIRSAEEEGVLSNHPRQPACCAARSRFQFGIAFPEVRLSFCFPSPSSPSLLSASFSSLVSSLCPIPILRGCTGEPTDGKSSGDKGRLQTLFSCCSVTLGIVRGRMDHVPKLFFAVVNQFACLIHSRIVPATTFHGAAAESQQAIWSESARTSYHSLVPPRLHRIGTLFSRGNACPRYQRQRQTSGLNSRTRQLFLPIHVAHPKAEISLDPLVLIQREEQSGGGGTQVGVP